MTAHGKDWDAAYASYRPPGWDIGRPQPAFVRLASSGVLHGRVLDAGCGTGEHALLAAANGADAVGVDVAPSAIEQARRKAVELGVSARFEVVDALDLEHLGMCFDVVIDSGLFHVLTDDARVQYVKSLASVTLTGSHCYVLCFSDRVPGKAPLPRRIRKEELVQSFRDGWTVTSIAADAFILNHLRGPVHAWLATVCRL